MTTLEPFALVAAGFGAGTLNAIVGSGTLITFPTLLLLGFPPVTANVSSGLGLVPGSAAAAWAHRRDLKTFRRMVLGLVPLSVLGAVVGALLLLRLPSDTFETFVPLLIALAVVLIVMGPLVARRQLQRGGVRSTRIVPLTGGVFLTAVYGGYFGAAQGVLMIGILGLATSLTLHESNGVKNALSACVNLVSALVYVAVGTEAVAWSAVAWIAVGASLGGLFGVRGGRAMSPQSLRALVVVVGLISIGGFLLT